MTVIKDDILFNQNDGGLHKENAKSAASKAAAQNKQKPR